MVGNLILRGRQIASKIVFFQLTVTCMAALLASIYSYVAGLSILLGGMVSILPSGLFAYIVFRTAGAQKSRSVVRSFYAGESIKFLLTLALFLLVFKYINIMPGLVILGYITALIANWLAIGRLKSTQY